MPNKTLTAKVKFETRSAEASLRRLSKQINNVQSAVNKSSKNTTKLTTQLNKASTATNRLRTATQKVAKVTNAVVSATRRVVSANQQARNSAKKIGDGYKEANKTASSLFNTVKKIAATYFGIQTIKLGIDTADTIISAKNRLNNAEGVGPELTGETMDKVYAAAQRARTNYSDLLSGASKSMTIASDAFQGNMDNAIRFEEIMAKSFTVAGASAEEQANSMYQLRQALGAGVLQGDELRSVMEQAPLMYDEIEKYVQDAIGTTKYSLKELASEGLVTSDMVVAAVMKAGDKIDEKFENTSITFAQAWNNIKSQAVKAFEPVAEKLEQMLNSESTQKLIADIGNAFVTIATVLGYVVDAIANFIDWCAREWDWLKYVIGGALLFIMALLVAGAAIAVKTAIIKIGAFMMEHAVLMVIVAAIMLLCYVYNLWKQGAIDTCEAIVWALMIVGMAILLIGVIMGSTVLVIIGAILVLVAIIFQYLDKVMGAIYVAGAYIYNFWVGIINAIIQWFYSKFVEPIASIIEWFVNAFNGGFDGVLGGFKNMCGQMLSMLIGLVKPFTKILDTLFGFDTTSAIESAQANMKSWGTTENYKSITVEAPTIERIAYSDAWDAGVSQGTEWKNSINNWGAQFQDGEGLLKNFAMDGLLDNDELAQLDANGYDVSDPSKLLEKANGLGLPNANDPSLAIDSGYDPSAVDDDIKKALNSLNGIEDDTSSISDSMSNDDLEYLRDLAEREWVNKFTTAEIKVDMTNNNSITSERDWEGMLTYLSDTLREEMTSVAYGV